MKWYRFLLNPFGGLFFPYAPMATSSSKARIEHDTSRDRISQHVHHQIQLKHTHFHVNVGYSSPILQLM
jgi:hypothetical protein